MSQTLLTRDDIALGQPLGRWFLPRNGDAHKAALTANTPQALLLAYEGRVIDEPEEVTPEEGAPTESALDNAFG